VREDDAIAEPVRHLEQPTQSVRDGVHYADLGIGERHAGDRRRYLLLSAG